LRHSVCSTCNPHEDELKYRQKLKVNTVFAANDLSRQREKCFHPTSPSSRKSLHHDHSNISNRKGEVSQVLMTANLVTHEPTIDISQRVHSARACISGTTSNGTSHSPTCINTSDTVYYYQPSYIRPHFNFSLQHSEHPRVSRDFRIPPGESLTIVYCRPSHESLPIQCFSGQ
jgi:hypothetical protein